MKTALTLGWTKGLSIGMLIVMGALWAGPARTQHAFSEAQGTVEDTAGAPVVGAVVTFSPRSNPTRTYSGKTDKKGRFVVSGLYTSKENDPWDLTIQAEGYLPVKMRWESRNVNRVLLGEPQTVNLKPNSKIPEIPIRPMGSVQVHFTVAPSEQVMQEFQQQLEQAAGTATGTGTTPGEGGSAPAKKDPWVEALTRANAGDLEGALPLFDEAIADAPQDAERHETRAKVLYQLERYGDAEAGALRAVALAPDRLDSLMVLCNAHVRQGEMDQALEVLSRARTLAPRDLRVLQQQAYVAGQKKDTPAAIAAYEAIIAIDPSKADAWLALGGLYAEGGDRKRSEQAYRKVAEIDPSNAYQTFYNLGVLIISKEDRSEADTRRAVEAFRKAVEIRPDYASAHKQLGFALLGLGDKAGTLKALQDYLRVLPNAPDAGQMQALIKNLER